MNPAYAMASMSDLVGKFGQSVNAWEENCAATIFFAELSEGDDEPDEEGVHMPQGPWIAKYEIYFTDDAIELTKNGEYIFNPVYMSMSSSYH